MSVQAEMDVAIPRGGDEECGSVGGCGESPGEVAADGSAGKEMSAA